MKAVSMSYNRTKMRDSGEIWYVRKEEESMKSSEKDRIDDWIEANVYGFFKRCMDEKRYPTQLEASMIAPLLQMYQSKQIDTVSEQLSDLWRAFIDGDVGIWFNHSTSLDVNVKDMPPSGENKQPTRK